MHILIAPNAFKNSLAADKAAAAIQRGLARSRLTATSECFPVGDGGDGTGDLLIDRLGAQRIPAKARDPMGRMLETYFGMSPSFTAIIEMASASGLRLLPRSARDPLHASSAGTGDLIRAALDHHANRIIIGMGGSATVDGGAGILQALGVGFYNSGGRLLTDLPLQLGDLSSIDMANVDLRLAAAELIVLCDVTNPLTGPDGAAAVFGPQKGASPAAVRILESGLIQFAKVIARRTGIDLSTLPRGGTAGGAAAGMYSLLGARLVGGIDYFLEVTGFDRALGLATHVITGEGSIDRQTLQGKAPFGVACRAKAKGIPVIALTGRLPDDPVMLRPYFDEIISINPPRTAFAVALADTAANLERAALEWGNRMH
ncbi:MAG TPA: glycerate kinase [Puia sp.]|nr:glycerate kinase [Puia sp.]